MSSTTIGAYDTVCMLKAGVEKAQSIDPKAVAAAMPGLKFKTFYGGETTFGGKESYGVDIAPKLPIYITQAVDGKLVELAKVDPRDN